MRRALLPAALAAALVAGAAGTGTASAAAPPVVGTWTWTDHDELLAHPRNPSVARIMVRRGRVVVRFGGQGASRVRVWRRGRSFSFTTRRWGGPKGRARLRVRYTGRVATGPDGPRISGRFDVLHRRYPGLSAFSAVPRD